MPNKGCFNNVHEASRGTAVLVLQGMAQSGLCRERFYVCVCACGCVRQETELQFPLEKVALAPCSSRSSFAFVIYVIFVLIFSF